MDYSKLRVNTKVKNESLELDEPASPTTEYFLSEVVTLYVLGFMELEIPVDFLTIFDFIKDVFAKAHPRFYSIVIREKDPGQLRKKQSTATIFINVRSMKGNFNAEEMRKGKLFGNRITNIEVPFPHLEDIDLIKPLQFIKKAHNIIKRKRNGALGLHLMAGLLEVIRTIGGLKAAARTLERRWKNCSFAITNMIGPTDQVSFGNHPINGFYFVPTGINMSLIVSVLTYMDNIRLGFVVENRFIDPHKFMPCVEKAFQLIFEAATTTSKL
ncbi:O-acyltransferase WSD1-like [Chenopodium quinoa]|uniref:O-acyltransferase WSD1-like n=1 Tax=Chenopodium quinoa TaxID=63459 RepID=UPI000B78D6EE|nr:O-acyltransferase WSD1-like [Chenopodium quinoa]